ncbi:natural resistance-associated macrophage protein [Basidiobolus meristosporus CBS 931.73]|uniref:Natural resistance-associated macrophage protein n=1 Tax=Basidiobolus meristosporus CBS 931.73 TaxID=1314790 RepID=A0A1Y1Z1Z9_9FUNG|nr:natural resistance-associated macrophage protein [Basidiobolus meristosporus CBS 931.73]|eukprot:ORY04321.1 natural resistance-associated macrophage protein [Basidiobolus meristosporus CBS 931.73]
MNKSDLLPCSQQPKCVGYLQKAKIFLKKLFSFIGPGYMVAVGYMDPGNWATDLSGGSQFGYTLLFVILLSNVMAVLLQSLCIRLGVVTGCDLAQMCRKCYSRPVNLALYVLCEIAIVACDLAEVIGSAIALEILFKIPLPYGVLITTLDVFLILLANRNDSAMANRFFECFIILLVGGVGACFVIQLVYVKPDFGQVMAGYLPSAPLFTNSEVLYVAIGIVGATVMPHNLYLHSHIVKLRSPNSDKKNERTQEDLVLSVKSALSFSVIDCVFALTFALFVNSAILIVAAAAFHYRENNSTQVEVADLFDAHKLLSDYLGPIAGTSFALALLLAGQSSTITATMAGQIVMEGFLGLTMRPWLRRLITRAFAIVPAMVVAIVAGSKGLNEVLIASQVILSLQLPFAVIPLVLFTSSKTVMQLPPQQTDIRMESVSCEEIKNDSDDEVSLENEAPVKLNVDFTISTPMKIVTWIVAIIIVLLNVFLLVQVARGQV